MSAEIEETQANSEDTEEKSVNIAETENLANTMDAGEEDDLTSKHDSAGLVRRAFVKSLPVLAGYIVLGTGFGMLAYSKGLGIWWPILMSVFIFAGSMQYVAIDLFVGGVGFITMAITTLAVNARHLLYGLSMLEKYKGTGKRKPYLIFALTDETYSLLCKDDADKRNNNSKFYLLVSLFDQSYWVAGTIIGVLAGRFIPISTEGIDFSLTALFVTVVVEQWCEVSKAGEKAGTGAGFGTRFAIMFKKHWPTIIGGICAIICRVIFGSSNFLIPTMIAIVIALSAPQIINRIAYKNEEGDSDV